MNFYYIKISCPKEQDGNHFGLIFQNIIREESFNNILQNIPNKLNEAQEGDVFFLHIGGDNNNKRNYFSKNPELQDYQNGIYGIGIISKIMINEKAIEADFYGFKKPITKNSIYFFPQFIDNLGATTKGTPNQAGLYDLSEDTALSFIDYVKINNIEGSSAKILEKIPSNNKLFSVGLLLIENEREFLTETTKKLFQKLSKVGKTTVTNEGVLDFSVSSFISDLTKTGLFFSEKLIHRFCASLLTKQFVLLTGLSGSGKTKIAEAFSNWISNTDRQICFVPVGADWTNREPLLGFPNALQKGEYVKPDTGVLDLLIAASENPEDPYFLILDEMNLSHVERYFADFLSAMESSDGSIYLHPDTEEWSMSSVPARIQLPRNLFIVGTVNIDETTYMFSPKVLDRANVIEFRVSKDEMSSYFESAKKVDITSISGAGSSCAQSFVQKALEHIEGDNAAVQQAVMPFFEIMQDAGAEFGFRTASEMRTFISKCTDISKGAMTKDEIIDAAVMQKILPKLHGSRNKIDKILEKLAELCFEQKPEKNIFDAPKESAKYPVSFEKLVRMRKRLHSDGFTSYAEA